MLAFAVTALGPGVARADDEEEPPKRYFYKALPYGSQSLFNPLQVLLNRGFDTYQLRQNREIGRASILDTDNVVHNVKHPFKAISRDSPHGWGTFLTQEIFPIDWSEKGARWVPNYSLHLIGGGQSYAALREWFLENDAPAPAATVFSIATIFTAALINESLENKGVEGFNTDCLADLYVFDVAGVVLFSFEAVRHFFSSTLILSEWSLQPAIMSGRGSLQNTGQYYALKYPLPFYPRLRLFSYGGMSTLGGLSWKIGDELSISAAGGVRVTNLVNEGGTNVVENVVAFRKSGAVFIDRNESLLFSLQVSDVPDYSVSANLYPNAFVSTTPGLGAWTAVGDRGRWLAGISFTHSLGFGLGVGTW